MEHNSGLGKTYRMCKPQRRYKLQASKSARIFYEIGVGLVEIVDVGINKTDINGQKYDTINFTVVSVAGYFQ